MTMTDAGTPVRKAATGDASVTIFDPAILALPLYEDRHRALAARLESWVARHATLPASLAGESEDERGRRYTRLLGGEGWLAYAVDPAEGRDRPDLRSVCLIREALAYLDDLIDFAFTIQGLAAAPIAWFATASSQRDLLPALRDGVAIGSLALSEPAVGSNLAALAATAVREGDEFVLTGGKTWVSNATIADYHMVLARTGEGPGGLGLSFLLVPGGKEGLRVRAIDLMAPRAFGSLDFDGCRLPGDAVIGQGGGGFRYAMEILDFYRVAVGAAAIGFARRAFQSTVEWCRGREVAGGGRLIQTQGTANKIADMAMFLDAAALLVARAAFEFDRDLDDVVAHASMAKLFATDGAARLIDETVQLSGAAGLVADSLPERLYRQIRALRIYEGTSEIQKMIIAGAASRPRL